MGNTQCCVPDLKQQEHQKLNQVHINYNSSANIVTSHQALPNERLAVDAKILQLIQGRNQFQNDLRLLKGTFQLHKYQSGQVYQGQCNSVPHGLGRLLLKDGSLIIGHFKQGKIQGSALYASKDEVYCSGQIVNGRLTCSKGLLITSTFKYQGEFKDNQIDGEGTETTQYSRFIGKFVKGKRISGKLTWRSEEQTYQYEGPFNQKQQFQGQGRLLQPLGSYQGSFVGGQKHGNGVYRYTSGLSYEGDYRKGKREGVGKIVNKDGSLCYEGEFWAGFPHGSGRSYKAGQVAQSGIFKQGIFQQLLQ